MPTLEELIPARYLAAIRAGDTKPFAGFWGDELELPEQGSSPLPPEAIFYYGYGACAHLAQSVCALVGSDRYGVVIGRHEGQASACHLFAVAGERLVDASGVHDWRELGGDSFRLVLVDGLDPLSYTLVMVSHAEWAERWLGEERFKDAITSDVEVVACAERAAQLLVGHYGL